MRLNRPDRRAMAALIDAWLDGAVHALPHRRREGRHPDRGVAAGGRAHARETGRAGGDQPRLSRGNRDGPRGPALGRFAGPDRRRARPVPPRACHPRRGRSLRAGPGGSGRSPEMGRAAAAPAPAVPAHGRDVAGRGGEGQGPGRRAVKRIKRGISALSARIRVRKALTRFPAPCNSQKRLLGKESNEGSRDPDFQF